MNEQELCHCSVAVYANDIRQCERSCKSPRVTLACDCVCNAWKSGKRKLPYLPPSISVHGVLAMWLAVPASPRVARHSLDLDTRQLFLRNKAWNLLLEPPYPPPTLLATVTLALLHSSPLHCSAEHHNLLVKAHLTPNILFNSRSLLSRTFTHTVRHSLFTMAPPPSAGSMSQRMMTLVQTLQ